jgi:hypothetical protein
MENQSQHLSRFVGFCSFRGLVTGGTEEHRQHSNLMMLHDVTWKRNKHVIEGFMGKKSAQLVIHRLCALATCTRRRKELLLSVMEEVKFKALTGSFSFFFTVSTSQQSEPYARRDKKIVRFNWMQLKPWRVQTRLS